MPSKSEVIRENNLVITLITIKKLEDVKKVKHSVDRMVTVLVCTVMNNARKDAKKRVVSSCIDRTRKEIEDRISIEPFSRVEIKLMSTLRQREAKEDIFKYELIEEWS